MKRWIFKLVILLLLGAILNAAVASGMRLWSELGRYGSTLVSLDDVPGELLPEILWTLRPESSYARIKLDGTGIEESWFILTTADGETSYRLPSGRSEWTSHRFVSAMMIERLRRGLWTDSSLVEIRIGLPAKSFIGRHSSFYPYMKSRNYEGAIRLPDWIIQLSRGKSRFDLPIEPLWPGFAINAVFYAAILWLLAIGSLAARHFIRNKRGLCIKCSYDLRGTSGGRGGGGCPECGWRREAAP